MADHETGSQATQTRIARYLSKQIDALQGVKSQREIAFEAGFERPNIMSMFKRGDTKIPLDRVPGLAKALHVDPAYLFRLALEQYWPDLDQVVEEIFGGVQTRNQREWWEHITAALGDDDPPLTQALARDLGVFLAQHRQTRGG